MRSSTSVTLTERQIFERGLVRVDEAVRNARLDAVDSELGARVFNGDNGSMMGGSV